MISRRLRWFLGVLILTLIGFQLMSPSRISFRATKEKPAVAANARHASSRGATIAAGSPRPAQQSPVADDPDLPPPPPVKAGLPGPVRIRAGQAIPEIFAHQTERDAVQALVTTYDPARIPEIAKYLSHQDAMVREAARLGLLQLGHRDAVPYIQLALKHATSEESAKLRADLEFLSLPSATIQ